METLFELDRIIVEMFDFLFMRRAILVGLLVSLCAALLGVNLVLKRYAMIGTSLSHVGFAAMVIATGIDLAVEREFSHFFVTLPMVVLAAFALLLLSENNKIKGDSAVALVSTSSLAIGIIIVSQTTGLNTDVCGVMFGSILAMTRFDVQLSVVLSISVLTLFVLFYKQLFAVTYDETFAKATGTKVFVYKALLAFLTAVTVVLGMRMMGALLIASLTIFPALSAMRLCKRFLSVVITAAIIAVTCFFVGMVLSYTYNLPPGASVVAVNLTVFVFFSGIALMKGRG
ncbi:MAG: metal ABC transporter permease [Oscillospiraceae bacterium]|nr:metal ABC transporter permease [Oscillospiraceae bacterium]